MLVVIYDQTEWDKTVIIYRRLQYSLTETMQSINCDNFPFLLFLIILFYCDKIAFYNNILLW